jgi:hypothetical protein
MVFRALATRALFTAALLLPLAASAGPLDSGLRLNLMGEFGFGGEFDTDKQGDSDARASAGFGAYGVYPLFQYFSVGLNVGFMWNQSKAYDDLDYDKSLWVDISPALIGRVVFAGGRAEANVTIPIGLTVSVPGSKTNDFYETGVGWNAGVLVGIDYLVASKFNVGAKLGWQGHGARNEGKSAGNGLGDYADLDYSVHQFALWFGAGWTF